MLTVGHSTHPIERFRALLAGGGVEVIADVRRYPGSRRNPQFGAAALTASLAEEGIAYESFGEQLGGRRSSAAAGERNAGWQNASFRAYADHMSEPEFAAGVARLERLACERGTAIMCAEADWHRCHRRLIADALAVRGWTVTHLLADGRTERHPLSEHAVVAEGELSYPKRPTLDV